MKQSRREGSNERSILIGMITDDKLMARISTQWRKDLFSSKWSNVVSSLCQRYFQKYGKAPGKQIESMFQTWSEKQRDESTINMVEKFLGSLSEEYKSKDKNNPEYLLDLARQHFNKVRLAKLVELVEGDLHHGEINEALSRLATFSESALDDSTSIDVLQDMNALENAFDKKTDVLVKYSGALGRFFEDHLCRDGFVAFQGPEKFGKSFWLYDVAWRGVIQRRKVAYFVIGDMSEHQVLKRIASRATKHPYRIKGGFPGEVAYPISLMRDEETRKMVVEFEQRKFKKAVSWKEAWKTFQKIQARLQTKRSLFKLSCHPSMGVSVKDIESILKTWEYGGWGTPDIVVIDYADNLAMPSGVTEYRNQINVNWKQMRALSQSLHALVVTATQADIGASQNETQTRQNFSEDKRKYAEVTAMFGINRTIEERMKGISRLNCLVMRDSEMVETQCVNVAGCYAIASPAIRSCF